MQFSKSTLVFALTLVTYASASVLPPNPPACAGLLDFCASGISLECCEGFTCLLPGVVSKPFAYNSMSKCLFYVAGSVFLSLISDAEGSERLATTDKKNREFGSSNSLVSFSVGWPGDKGHLSAWRSGEIDGMISASRLDWKPCSMFVWIGFPMLLVFFFSIHNGFDQKAQFTDRLGPKEVLRTNFCERVLNYYSWINTRRVWELTAWTHISSPCYLSWS